MSTVPPRPSAARRRGLGRGLEALLGPVGATQADEPAAATAVDDDAAVLTELDPVLVEANPEQPRREFPAEALQALAQSIRTHGLLHPIVVERHGGVFRLVAGERRLRAARLAGLSRVPAIVRPAAESARQSLEVALTENLVRSDLSPIEEAAAYSRLADTFGLSHEAIAMRLGRSRPTISNAIRLLALPAAVQRALVGGELTAGHARALLGLSAEIQQETMALQVIAGGWSVRQTEQAVQNVEGRAARPGRPAPSRPRQLNADDEALRRSLEQALGLPVELERRGRSTRVVISCADDQDLDALHGRLGGEPL